LSGQKDAKEPIKEVREIITATKQRKGKPVNNYIEKARLPKSTYHDEMESSSLSSQAKQYLFSHSFP
jgi:uncharacterized protein YpmS